MLAVSRPGCLSQQGVHAAGEFFDARLQSPDPTAQSRNAWGARGRRHFCRAAHRHRVL